MGNDFEAKANVKPLSKKERIGFSIAFLLAALVFAGGARMAVQDNQVRVQEKQVVLAQKEQSGLVKISAAKVAKITKKRKTEMEKIALGQTKTVTATLQPGIISGPYFEDAWRGTGALFGGANNGVEDGAGWNATWDSFTYEGAPSTVSVSLECPISSSIGTDTLRIYSYEKTGDSSGDLRVATVDIQTVCIESVTITGTKIE